MRNGSACIMQFVIDKRLSEYFSQLGRKSAKVRMKKISATKRKEMARKAARARWSKKGRGRRKREAR